MTVFFIKNHTGLKGVEMISENNNKVKHMSENLGAKTPQHLMESKDEITLPLIFFLESEWWYFNPVIISCCT